MADPAAAEPVIRLDRVTKRYPDGTQAVQELSLDVGAGEVAVLIGPSGCGKTTALKMINRLVEPSGGRVLLHGRDVASVDPVQLRRGIGYVIQQVGLFPHLTVRANVATVPGLLRWDRRRTAARIDELLTLVGLDPAVHGGRYPAQLSGGQRQRVGVARALAVDPPVLLMDEPFGAVDPIARDRLQAEFLRLQREVRKTVVFVTHDMDEAVALGDRIAVLRQGGTLEQFDTPANVLGAPASRFVADFVGGDRALRRLAVTRLDLSALWQPPTVTVDETLAAAGERLAGSAASWAVVLAGDGAAVGWLPAELAAGGGQVADRMRPLTPAVDPSTNLHQAFATILRRDTDWVAVLDGDRLLGVLDSAGVHAMLRRSVAATDPADPARSGQPVGPAGSPGAAPERSAAAR